MLFYLRIVYIEYFIFNLQLKIKNKEKYCFFILAKLFYFW